MRLSELKEKIDEIYDIAISEYRKTINCNTFTRDEEQATIRKIEEIEAEIFEDNKEFDFENIY